MQKLKLNQSLSQKLSPQQIQLIKLLQVPTSELQDRIQKEIEANPALEEDENDTPAEFDSESYDENIPSETNPLNEINLDEYMPQDDFSGYKMQGDGPPIDSAEKEIPITSRPSLIDSLIDQLDYLELGKKEHVIGMQLIGSIDNEGYIRRDLTSIINDLILLQNIRATYIEVENVLQKIQKFDPPGIAARNLQECLYIQINKSNPTRIEKIAAKIMLLCFELLKKKHYQKIRKKLTISEDELRSSIHLITTLDPKPGNTSYTETQFNYIIPDFILKRTNETWEVSLNTKNSPQLKISRSYVNMLQSYSKRKKKDKKLLETIHFIKHKIESAKWFIDSIKQRQETLLKTMCAIVEYQNDFFLSDDQSKLKPMILKDISKKISMDVSTVSRIANSKFIQTDSGVFSLRSFFSESIATKNGIDVSNRKVKYVLKRLIDEEDKKNPFPDDKIEELLKKEGYNIARRTVAKYREKMKIPVARLRKEI